MRDDVAEHAPGVDPVHDEARKLRRSTRTRRTRPQVDRGDAAGSLKVIDDDPPDLHLTGLLHEDGPDGRIADLEILERQLAGTRRDGVNGVQAADEIPVQELLRIGWLNAARARELDEIVGQARRR